MENRKAFNILMLCSLLLISGCSESNAPRRSENYNILLEEPDENISDEIIYEIEPEEEKPCMEEAESAYEVEAMGEDTEQWRNRIYLPVDEMRGNILGYSLLRMPPVPANNMYYEQDMSYLLAENVVGKGIYVSDYVCEVEVFLGDILKEILTGRGAISGENKRYFTEYAVQQLEDTDWELIEEKWEPDPYAYDREYCMNPIYGGSGYQFFYHFYPNQGKPAKEETNTVDVTLYVDGDGKICEIKIDISIVPAEKSGIETWIVMNGLFDDTYSEWVIRDGNFCNESIVWDFERYFSRFMNYNEVYEQDNKRLLESGNVCASAEDLADIFLQVMESRGADAKKYMEWFGYDDEFLNFADTDWESLGENWIADEEYNCFFIDKISYFGYAGFRFYFYPDFKSMGVDIAQAVVIDCNVDVYTGLLAYTNIDIFPVTGETSQAVKQNQDESRIPVVEKGTAILGNAKVAIPELARQVNCMPISEFTPDAVAVEHSSREVKEEIWGFTDAAEVSDYLGKKFLKDFDEDNVREGEINEITEDKYALYDALFAIEQFMDGGWTVCRKYDCYYVKSNEAEGCMHLQYYFYPEKDSEELTTGKTLVIDVYLSESGIEYMRVNEFCAEYSDW